MDNDSQDLVGRIEFDRHCGPIVLQPCLPGSFPRRNGLQNVGSVDGFGFSLAQPDNTTYILAYDWPNGGTISQLRITAGIGNGLVSVLINGIVVSGLDHQPFASGTRAEISATGNNTFAPGDDVFLRIDSGAMSLVNVQGTLVVTNKSIFQHLPTPPMNFVSVDIPLVGPLASANPIPFTPAMVPLHRNPINIPMPLIKKNSPDEDDVTIVSILPFTPLDFTFGWSYKLSGLSIPGQILPASYYA